MRILILTISLFLTAISYSQADQPIKNVSAFARLYGYVRYFHPSDEAASINWNQFAIYGAGRVADAPNDAELLKRLQQLFAPIAPSALVFAATSPQTFQKTTITPPSQAGYAITAWQHFGVGISERSVYNSIRLNRPEPQDNSPKTSFGPFTQSIDAEALRGKMIRLKGWMKTTINGNEGSGHFWLRVDRKKGTGFFNNMDATPITSAEWKEYSFTGKVDDDAKQIAFGAFLKGSGKMEVDQLELQILDSNEWKSVTIANGSFEEVYENKLPKNWFFNASSKDYRFTTQSNNAKEGSYSMEVSSINSTAPAKTMAKPLFPEQPQLGDVVNATLPGNIGIVIPIVLYADSVHTHPAGDKAKLKQLQDDIAAFSKTHATADDQSVRLGDVVIAWNIFRHFYPYWEDASKTSDQLLQQTIASALKDKTALEFRRTLQLMTEPLNDGHIRVSLRGDSTETHRPPMTVDWVENKLVVDHSLDSKAAIRAGDIITKVDGKDATEVFNNRKALISGSDQWKNYRALDEVLAGPANSSIQLHIIRDGATMELLLKRNVVSYDFYAAQNNLRRPSGELKEGVYYLDLDKINGDTITSWSKKLAGAKAIICDLRGYPNSNHNLINHLLTKKEDDKWMFVPKIIRPDYEKVEYSPTGWNMGPIKPHFGGKVVFITDGQAISYAESFMGYIKDQKLATIVGQPTAGTNGNINPFSLPGGYYISWTGMLVKNHDGSKHHLTGITPDVPAQRTVKGIREGRDELLEKALEVAEKEGVKKELKAF